MQRQSLDSDSGIDSASDTESEDECYTASTDSKSNIETGMFAEDIPEDSIEVLEACHVGNEAVVEVRFPEGKNLSSIEVEEANAIALMHKLGKTAIQRLFPGNPNLLAERVCATISQECWW